jgi:hypothetical protein
MTYFQDMTACTSLGLAGRNMQHGSTIGPSLRLASYIAMLAVLWFSPIGAPASDIQAPAAGGPPLATEKRDCAETIAKPVATRMHYVLGENAPFDSALVVCKYFPGETGVALVAIVIKSADADATKDTDENTPLDLDLMKVNSVDQIILDRLVQHRAFMADEAGFHGVGFDTAPYRIAPGVRAFGIRWSSTNNGGEVETLNLFVADGKSIRRVLVFDTSSGEHVACQGDYTESTLSIAASAHHGYADLNVRTVRTENSTDTRDCNGKQTQVRTVEKYSLRYDGSQYVSP